MHLDNDPEFSTSHDSKAAEIIAYGLLTSYYTKELKKLLVKEEKITMKIDVAAAVLVGILST